MSAPVTHYLNTDFDLSLRPRPRQLGHEGLHGGLELLRELIR